MRGENTGVRPATLPSPMNTMGPSQCKISDLQPSSDQRSCTVPPGIGSNSGPSGRTGGPGGSSDKAGGQGGSGNSAETSGVNNNRGSQSIHVTSSAGNG